MTPLFFDPQADLTPREGQAPCSHPAKVSANLQSCAINGSRALYEGNLRAARGTDGTQLALTGLRD